MHLKRIRIASERFPVRDCYPFHLRVLQETDSISFPVPVVFFVGENGSGKTTFLEAVARRCGIHIWKETERTRIRNNVHEEDLHRALEAEWTAGSVPGSYFSSEWFRYFSEILEGWAKADPGILEYFGGRSLTSLSHGQSLMAFFESRYRIRGLYCLDEPETALSPRNQKRLLSILERATAGGAAQFIIATHSPILLSCPGALLYSFDHVPVRPIPFEETDPFRVYRDFFSGLSS
jgi:predicted ATPase